MGSKKAHSTDNISNVNGNGHRREKMNGHSDLSSHYIQTDDPAEQLRTLLSALDSFALISKTDEHGVITYANQKFSNVSGYSVEELMGKPHSIVRSPHHPKKFFKEMWDTIKSGKSWKGEIQNQSKDNKPYWVYSLILPMSSRKKNPQEYLSIRFDITELKKANERQAFLLGKLNHSNQELVDFAYHVAHDLKSPLRSVQAALKLLLKDLQEPIPMNKDNAVAALGMVMNRLNRLEHLIVGLLDLARVGIEVDQRELVPMDELVNQVIDLVRPQGKEITFNVALEGIVLRGERVKFHQLFQNLLSNSIKFMDKPKGAIEVGVVEKDGQRGFYVRDNGPGIRPEYKDKIFDLFFTGEAPTQDHHNTGVGLATVKKIVNRYGGKIWIESKSSKGVTFYFTLPFAMTSVATK